MFWVGFDKVFICVWILRSMCLAIPGKVVEIDGDDVLVDYVNEKRVVKTLLDVEVGDYVIVGGKMILEKVSKEDAIHTIKIFEGLI